MGNFSQSRIESELKERGLKRCQVLSPDEVCRMLQISRSTLYAWIRKGRIPEPCVQLAGFKTFFLKSDIVGFKEGKEFNTDEDYANI